MQLDGDIAESVVPADWMPKVFHDPFAFKVLLNGERYPNPNRFFCHTSMFLYLRNMPLALQAIFDPVDSIYLSCALLKTTLQFLFIFFISYIIISWKDKRVSWDILLPALIIIPLFQNEGYNRYMGVIDQSITYTFFYALPIFLLFVFYVPIYITEIRESDYNLNWVIKTGMIFLAIILPFSGPLIPGVALISNALILLKKTITIYNQAPKQSFLKKLFYSISKIPQFLLFILTFLSVLSLYSFYIGTYNSNNTIAELPLYERYLHLPLGLYSILTTRMGWPLLLFISVLNVFILSKRKDNLYSLKVLDFFKWMCIFSIIYVLMLPLGGYRIYRPNIIRYDTILPITICFIFFYGASTTLIIRSRVLKNNAFYITLVASVALIFTIADIHKLDQNKCEKSTLQKIAKSPQRITLLKGGGNCSILSWDKINNDKTAEMNAFLLKYWKIID